MKSKSYSRLGTTDIKNEIDMELVGKYNLAPEFQHVKATYMNTDKTVQKMRRQAQEYREEQRKEKNN